MLETVYGGPVPMTYGDYPHFGNEPPRPGSDLIDHELMNGVVFYYGQRYYISPLDLAVLEDVGVPVNTLLLLGDTNDDGKIDGADLAALNANMGQSVTDGYAGGDFNGDGVVNGDDFALVYTGIGQLQRLGGKSVAGAGGCGRDGIDGDCIATAARTDRIIVILFYPRPLRERQHSTHPMKAYRRRRSSWPIR